jgi:DNA-binding response OmpR family regulator
MAKILIVEDDRMLSKLYENKIFELGHEVISAYDGYDGIEKFKKERPDLIVLDIVFPIKNGLEVLREIRKSRDGDKVKIIVMSRITDDKIVEKIIEENKAVFLKKDRHTINCLLSNIDEMLKK